MPGDLIFAFETDRHQELCALLSKKPPLSQSRRGSATASLQTAVPLPSVGIQIAARVASSLDSGLAAGEPYDRVEVKAPFTITPNVSDSYFDDLKKKYQRIQCQEIIRTAEGDPGRKREKEDPEYMAMQPLSEK